MLEMTALDMIHRCLQLKGKLMSLTHPFQIKKDQTEVVFGSGEWLDAKKE